MISKTIAKNLKNKSLTLSSFPISIHWFWKYSTFSKKQKNNKQFGAFKFNFFLIFPFGYIYMKCRIIYIFLNNSPLHLKVTDFPSGISASLISIFAKANTSAVALILVMNCVTRALEV